MSLSTGLGTLLAASPAPHPTPAPVTPLPTTGTGSGGDTAVDAISFLGLTGGALLLLVIVVGSVVLWFAAIFSIMASRMTFTQKIVAVILTFCFPLLGPLVWFVFVRRSVIGTGPMHR